MSHLAAITTRSVVQWRFEVNLPGPHGWNFWLLLDTVLGRSKTLGATSYVLSKLSLVVYLLHSSCDSDGEMDIDVVRSSFHCISAVSIQFEIPNPHIPDPGPQPSRPLRSQQLSLLLAPYHIEGYRLAAPSQAREQDNGSARFLHSADTEGTLVPWVANSFPYPPDAPLLQISRSPIFQSPISQWLALGPDDPF